jgi:RNA polymerase sigma-70 factor (ECF subfamily)
MRRAPLPAQRSIMGFTAQTAVQETADEERAVRRAVVSAREGDEDAIRFLYVTYANNVYGYVRSIVRDDYEAEDITQHVFAKLVTALQHYDERGVPFVGWLLRLARNAAIDHIRSMREAPAPEIFGADERSEDVSVERSACLREALATLPVDQRNVVVLRHLLGLTPREIAARVERTESAIHGLHHRGRRALQAELRRQESAPSTVTLAR